MCTTWPREAARASSTTTPRARDRPRNTRWTPTADGTEAPDQRVSRTAYTVSPEPRRLRRWTSPTRSPGRACVRGSRPIWRRSALFRPRRAASVRRLRVTSEPSSLTPLSRGCMATKKTLFDFDSKHITKPGNKLASNYLFETCKSFGYEPELQWFEQRTAVDGRTANVIADARGNRESGADLRRRAATLRLRWQRDLARTTTAPGTSGAARNGPTPGRASAAGDDHLRVLHGRRGPGSSEAASSFGGRSRTRSRSSARSTTGTWSAGRTTTDWTAPSATQSGYRGRPARRGHAVHEPDYSRRPLLQRHRCRVLLRGLRRHRRRHRVLSGARNPHYHQPRDFPRRSTTSS